MRCDDWFSTNQICFDYWKFSIIEALRSKPRTELVWLGWRSSVRIEWIGDFEGCWRRRGKWKWMITILFKILKLAKQGLINNEVWEFANKHIKIIKLFGKRGLDGTCQMYKCLFSLLTSIYLLLSISLIRFPFISIPTSPVALNS